MAFNQWLPGSTSETAEPTNAARMGRARRTGSAALLSIALATGALGGSAVGSFVTAQVIAPRSAQAQSNGQTIAQTTQVANVAGAVYNAVGPSVVEISTSSTVQTRSRFGQQYQASGIGSGFVLDTSGLIATNNHVVNGASSISVTFSNGKTSTATVVGTDSANDLALIKVASMPSDIPAATLGDSSSASVGDMVVAIGSPFGLEETVTQGIISAVNRSYSESGSILTGLLQTDASINPGNSGGPLVNASGQVIGINTMIESPVEGNVGIGFSVPINTLKQQLAQLQAGATLQQGYLGVSVQESADVQGVTVAEVAAGSGAAAAGLQQGDVITAVGGATIRTYSDLAAQISGKQPGTVLPVTVQRNGQAETVNVTLQAQQTTIQQTQ